MRDSLLKRVLLVIYFNYHEFYRCLRLIFCGYKPLLRNMNYDEYWQHKPAVGLQPRYMIMARKIDNGDTVLDVGCGDGSLLAYLKNAKNIKELGIDISSVAIKRALAKGINARVEPFLDFAKNDRRNLFDHIIMSEVLEHLANAEDYVRLGFKLAKKTLMISYPNIAYWPYRLRLLLGRFPVQWAYHPGEHLRFWSISDFKDWIKGLDLPGSPYKLFFYPSNGITLFNLHKILPNIFCWQITIVIRKKP